MMHPLDASKTLASTKILDTGYVNRAFSSSDVDEEDIAAGNLSINITAVCKIDGYNDYFIYRVSENVLLTVSTHLSSPVYTELSDLQQRHVHGRELRYLRVNILITNWTKGDSTFDTLSFSVHQEHNYVHRVIDPAKVADDMDVRFHEETNDRYSADFPNMDSYFSFPEAYFCIFKCKIPNIDLLESTLPACLVHFEQDNGVWQPVCSVEHNDDWRVPHAKIAAVSPAVESSAANSEVESSSGKKVRGDEKRVYVWGYEDSITLLRWIQNNKQYWMTVFFNSLF